MHTIMDRETWNMLREKLGRQLTTRVHQEEETRFTFDLTRVPCPAACDDHAVRIHMLCNLKDFIKTVQHLKGAQILQIILPRANM